MPLLSPNQIEKVLKQTPLKAKESSPEEVKRLLNANGVGVEDTIETLGQVMRGADNSATRLKAAEISMKLHGILSNDQSALNIPIVNITILGDAERINPILLPR